MPFEVMIWRLVEYTGWTLDYIDTLPIARLHEWMQITDGTAKGRNSLLNKGGG